jgi:hypothetical protein
MAGAAELNIVGSVAGLAEELQIHRHTSVTTTPTKTVRNRQIQAVANTAEALDMGSVTTVGFVVLTATDNNLLVDTSYSVAFSSELTVPEGETVVFRPTGTLYIKNGTSAETVTVDYVICGT